MTEFAANPARLPNPPDFLSLPATVSIARFRLQIIVPGPLRFRRLAVPQTSWNLLHYARESLLRQSHFGPISLFSTTFTRTWIERGLEHDLLLLSGGVSAGKYDIVESVLAEFGAEFYFDRVLIQPGQPLVFGRAAGRFFFGLPGNPASTMVTFEIFARAAVQLLGGESDAALPVTFANLTSDLRPKPGLTRFLPARLASGTGQLTPMKWSGSGDVPAMARANAYLVLEPERESWSAGDAIRVGVVDKVNRHPVAGGIAKGVGDEHRTEGRAANADR